MGQILFCIYDIRKLQDGGTNGQTEAEHCHLLSQCIGVDEHPGYCKTSLSDYFVTRPIGNDDSDSDVSKLSEDYCVCV